VTTEQMNAMNRRTRIIKRIKAGDCLHVIANDERVTYKHVNQIARSAKLPHCNHVNHGHVCRKHEGVGPENAPASAPETQPEVNAK